MFKRVRQTDGQKSDLDSNAHKVTLAKIVKELLSYIRDLPRLPLPKLQKYMWPTAWGQHRPSSDWYSQRVGAGRKISDSTAALWRSQMKVDLMHCQATYLRRRRQQRSALQGRVHCVSRFLLLLRRRFT